MFVHQLPMAPLSHPIAKWGETHIKRAVWPLCVGGWDKELIHNLFPQFSVSTAQGIVISNIPKSLAIVTTHG